MSAVSKLQNFCFKSKQLELFVCKNLDRLKPLHLLTQGYYTISGLQQIDCKEHLTVKGEVAEKSSQQVHDKHGQDGDVGNSLHALLVGTEEKPVKKEKNDFSIVMCKKD